MRKKLLVILFLLPFTKNAKSDVIDSLKSLIKKTNNTEKLISINTEIGLAYTKKGEFEQSNKVFYEIIKKVNKQGKKSILAASYNEIGNNLADMGNNSLAFSNYQKALSYTNDEDYSLKAKIYKNTGALFLSWKNFDKALYYYKKSQSLAIKGMDERTAADCLNNMGTVYEQQFKYNDAFKVYNQALKFYLENNINDRICLTYNNLAILSKVTKQFKQSSDYYKDAVFYAEKAENAWLTAAIATNLGNLLSETGKQQESEAYLLKALKLAQKIEAKELETETLENLALNAARKNDFKQAYEYHQKFSTEQNRFINLENTKEVTRLQEQFDAVSREKQIEGLNKENTIQKLTISKRNTTIAIIAAIFLFVFIIGLLIFSRNKLKQETRLQGEILKQQDFATKAVLEAEEKERTRIAIDLHDGVGQLFSTVKMNLSGLTDMISFKSEKGDVLFKNVLSLVDESCKEVRTISHQMAPYVLLKSGLVAALRDFITKIDEDKLRINLDVIGLQNRLDKTIETVLFRVIQEIVNNTIKHAKANVLDIQLVEDEDGLSIMMEDDGVGFDALNHEKFDGMGLKNMHTRVAYLKGAIHIDAAPGKGTLVNILIPVKIAS